jgi:hypothetical protein
VRIGHIDIFASLAQGKPLDAYSNSWDALFQEGVERGWYEWLPFRRTYDLTEDGWTLARIYGFVPRQVHCIHAENGDVTYHVNLHHAAAAVLHRQITAELVMLFAQRKYAELIRHAGHQLTQRRYGSVVRGMIQHQKRGLTQAELRDYALRLRCKCGMVLKDHSYDHLDAAGAPKCLFDARYFHFQEVVPLLPAGAYAYVHSHSNQATTHIHTVSGIGVR